ncbi:glycosyltransferase [Nostoc sp. CENA67]|uniref:Glycosyltransferase n=1 Tax=Amazonocrinis nigriterrae CENA67 TaxID=2794033 RepID=A0A8J7LBB5_9NOST|nr:glycosyltransferase [Amazonocrinis nigriterrae]MBH8565585.1 glycosyltransferase [Amazonocrinis nigriterrae CENA67]
MKIQVFEQFYKGHHSNYIEIIIPEFSRLVERKLVEEVIITITKQHFDFLKIHERFPEYSKFITFDISLPEVSSKSSLDNRKQVAANLLNAVNYVKPNYLISTSADYQSLIFAIQNYLGIKSLPNDLNSLGIFHYGYSGATNGIADYIKQLVYSFTWKNCNCSRLLMVNPVVYEALVQDRLLQGRIGIVPDPVPSSVLFDKETARKMLNIPTDGKYVGFIGAMDTRKAIPELVAAFKNAKLSSDTYLLLAGKLNSKYRQIIESEFTELLNQGRIILLDRFLSSTELIAGFCALDVTAVVQYKRPNLSENILKAIAAQRPVIADNYGHTGMIIERFGVGWSCNLTDHEALVLTLEKGLAESDNYVLNTKTERLIEFHRPDNFVNTLLYNLNGLLPSDSINQVKTWEWVCDSETT